MAHLCKLFEFAFAKGCTPGPQRVAHTFGGVVPSLATWFTPSLQVMQRSKGRSAVAAAAYRSCTHLHDERVDIQHDYRPKTGHVSTELFGVSDLNLGLEDIGLLWNNAELSENRKNSAVARELMVPLPSEWNDEQRRQCVRGLSEMLVARYGVAVMASIHRPAHGLNDHVHILFTTREVDAQMNFGKKTRILDDVKTGEVKNLREEVCRVVNEHAKANNADWYVYAGKFAEVDESHIPTIHIPVNAPKDLREAMEGENRAIVDARPLIKRIMDASKATTVEMDIALKAIATWSKEKPLISKAPAAQELVPTAPPLDRNNTTSLVEQVQASHLATSLDLRHAYREICQAHAKRKEGREVADKWRSCHRELEAEPPGLVVSLVAKMARGLGVRDTVTVYEEKIAKACGAIERCRLNDKSLTTFINDPERKRKYQEWQQWPEHRQRVEEYEATLPDAPRTSALSSVSKLVAPSTKSPGLEQVLPEPYI